MKDVTFKTKLRSYSLLTGSLLATGLSANAQIIYTDVTPDDTINLGNEVAYDLDNDGNVDVKIRLLQFQNTNIIWIENAHAYSTAWVTGSYFSSNRLPYVLNSGDSICAGEHFQELLLDPGILLSINTSQVTLGNWQGGVMNKFLGLRFRENQYFNNTLYGWIRLDVSSDASSVIVKDFASQLDPSLCLTAGEGLPLSDEGFSQVSPVGFLLYPTPASSKLFISGLNENFNRAEVSAHDLSGRKIFSQKISSSQNEIDVSSLPNGVYLLELKNEDETFTKKFEVKK